MATTLKLVYLVPELGEYAIVPDGAIVNIGGVIGPNFTVGGRPLLFADGTTSDGGTSNFTRPDFQSVYTNTLGEAIIDFTTGKDFVLQAVNNKQFRFDADTGDVTVGGNLIVQGDTVSVIHAAIDTDRVRIGQSAGNYIPFIMEPLANVTPTVNVVDIKVARGGASVFTIGPTGQTFIQSLNTGLVNGVDVTVLAASLAEHLNDDPDSVKHTADQISADTAGLGVVTGDSVQEAIESLAGAVNTLIEQQARDIRGLEHVQNVPSNTWIIAHNLNTKRVQITIWDSADEQVLADVVRIVNSNTIEIKFNTLITGRAILMLF